MERLLSALRDKVPDVELRARFKVGTPLLRQLRREHGIGPGRSRPKLVLSEAQIEEMRALRGAKKTWDAVANRLGVKRKTLWEAIRRQGIRGL